MHKSLSWLKESTNDFSNTYTTALLAYVFSLAGDMETRAHLLQHLDSIAIKQGGSTHWTQTASETSASLSVEISSYVLMAKLSHSHSAEDLGYASSIIRWLTSQQNYYGGFSSTQDTVVALQALSLYSSVGFSPAGSNTVTVQSPSGQLTFNVNPANKLLYQEKMLQDATGKYSLEVKGTGCASVQVSDCYLKENLKAYKYVTTTQLHNLFFFSSYSGKEESTNMLILDIALLSGFIPDPQSLKDFIMIMIIKQSNFKDGHVLVYLKEVREMNSMELVLLQQIPVHNLKPAVIALYDYYQPSKSSYREHKTHCTLT
uniref:Alpha-macroglobulin receptor-binding domain-containing protein n=1 Tax=Kryptolebias marmoratus TaxID=37003 RepID=A0A3Q3AKQ6_KRYMA